MKKKVYILGGGFGGVYSALELERRLGSGSNLDITLVNRDNFFLFTPMLHEVAASDLELTTIVNPMRKLLRKVQLFAGEVEHIDLRNSRLTLSHGFKRHSHTVPYDQLILALGSIPNFHNLPGLADRAITMKSLGDAVAMRNRLIAHLEEADTDCAKEEREPLLTFVVAGGGFAGVETIAAVNDFLRQALPLYRNLHEKMLRLVLVHPGTFILPELGEELGKYTQAKLEKRGIQIILNARVSAVSDDSVALTNGMVIRSSTIVWTAGTTPNPLLEALPCSKDHGRVVVNDYLQIPDFRRHGDQLLHLSDSTARAGFPEPASGMGLLGARSPASLYFHLDLRLEAFQGQELVPEECGRQLDHLGHLYLSITGIRYRPKRH